MKITDAEDVCLAALVCWGQAFEVLDRLDAAAEMARRGDLDPARAAAKRRKELGPAIDELKRRIDQHCGDHGNGQGGPRVTKALLRLKAKQTALYRSLAQAQRVDPMGLSPPHADGAEVPTQAAVAAGTALATEALAAITAALAEWGPVLAPAAL